MKNNTQGKILNILIDKYTKNVERYTHNGSTWLIFTEEKKWVIELTKEGTLWYNYYFFQNIMKLLSLDVVENQHYITKWVEDTVINGVKHTRLQYHLLGNQVEDTIQNGIKKTKGEYYKEIQKVEYTIQNGVKETKHNTFEDGLAMEEAIQNGVKQTHLGGKDRKIDEIENIIENGVKETWGYEYQPQIRINEVINKGEKTVWNNDTTEL